MPLFEIFVSTHFILGKQTINIKPQQRKYFDCAAYVLNFFFNLDSNNLFKQKELQANLFFHIKYIEK